MLQQKTGAGNPNSRFTHNLRQEGGGMSEIPIAPASFILIMLVYKFGRRVIICCYTRNHSL